MKAQTVHKIEISHRTIIFTVLFLLFLWFLYQIRHFLLIFFVGVIITVGLNPLVEKLEKIKIPRILAVVLIYILILAFFGLVLAGIIPPLVNQTGILLSRLSQYLEYIRFWSVDKAIVRNQIEQLSNRLESFPLDLIKLTAGIFGNFITFFVLIFISFYLLAERKNLDRYLLKLFGPANMGKATSLVEKIEKRLGIWVRAQLILMFVVGILSYIGLRILGIDFALPLALLAGILEVVPNVGPVVSSIPAILSGLLISPLMGLAAAALYFLVQQLENNLIVPQIMAKEVGVNPLITIFALIIGFKLGGISGAILAIPLVIVGETLLKELVSSKNF